METLIMRGFLWWWANNFANKTNRHSIHRTLLQRSTVRRQFKQFDTDGSGYITMEDIKQFWEELTGGEVAIAKIEETLKDIDKDGDGLLIMKVFFSWWANDFSKSLINYCIAIAWSKYKNTINSNDKHDSVLHLVHISYFRRTRLLKIGIVNILLHHEIYW